MNDFRLSRLDRVWHGSGAKRLRWFFASAARKDAREALRLVNADALSFPVLFILREDIEELGLYPELSPRNLAAIQVCALKSKPARRFYIPTDLLDADAVLTTLRWMLATGKYWDGPSHEHDAYDAVMDYASALLTGTFDDKEALPHIAELIFRRNRKGYYIHDLVWSFFQAPDPDALVLVASRLKSSDPRDVELAGRLLGLELPSTLDRRRLAILYERYLRWLEENRQYLYLTGEHFQMTSQPHHLDVDREAKYLQKAISPRDQTPAIPLTEDEMDCLNRFRQTPETERDILASFSQKLRERDKRSWDEWMHSQVAEQVIAARKDQAASDDYY